MNKMQISCGICDQKTDFPPPENWSYQKNDDMSLCGKCRWGKHGNRLLRVFGFKTSEEAAGLLHIPPRAFVNLNYDTAGDNLRNLARHIVRFAVNLDERQRSQAIATKCLWPKLSERIAELFELPNITRVAETLRLSRSTTGELNNRKSGKTLIRLMEILVNLAEMLTKSQRNNFLRNKKFLLD